MTTTAEAKATCPACKMLPAFLLCNKHRRAAADAPTRVKVGKITEPEVRARVEEIAARHARGEI